MFGHMTHWLVNHHITGHTVFVFISTEWVMMCPTIDNPASCEICAVIHFLHAKNMSAVEIHRKLCTVYGQNVMSEGTVTQWCRLFKDGRINVHNEEWVVSQPSLVSDDLVQSVDQKSCERWCFTILELVWISTNFTHCSLEINTVRLGYHKFCTRWVLKMLIGVHKMQRMASALTFWE
jgi:hypothetical protein